MNVDYREYPDHPLHDVPQKALDAARRYLREAFEEGIGIEDAEPVADAVVMTALPALREWLQRSR